MPAQRIVAQLIAHQSVQPIEALAHIRRPRRHGHPRRRSQAEHGLTPLGNRHQPHQSCLVKVRRQFHAAVVSQHQHETASCSLGFRQHPHRPQSRPRVQPVAPDIVIQRRHRDPKLAAKFRLHLPASSIFLRHSHARLRRSPNSHPSAKHRSD